MSGSVFRTCLFVLMLLLLAFPIFQDATHIIKPMPLHGAIILPVRAHFSWQNWWSGRYQDSMSEFCKGKTGLRPDLTRLSNQIDYTFFGRMHGNGVIEGKNNFLYESGYITSYCGSDRLPYSTWAERLYKLKKIQDTLAHLGVAMVLAEAGSKGNFYPEYFPDDMRCDHRGLNNHDLVNHISDSLHLRYIDYNNWFLSMKGKEEGLYTPQGIHWSLYAATLAVDSMVHYMQYTEGIEMPDLRWAKGDPHVAPQETDVDIYRGLNLMMKPKRGKFYYPYLWYENQQRDKPKITFIADSYMWTWMIMGVPGNISKDWEFWYYNNQVFSDQEHGTPMANYDWLPHLLQSRFVVIMFSESNISVFGWGFIEKAYAHFYEVPKPA